MPATAMPTPRFLRKTALAATEYRKNFRQIDNDVIDLLTSPEADAVTPLMSKIYLKLLNAPDRLVEGPGVLRFEQEITEGQRRTAWQALCHLLGVSSSTANKAIKWLHQQGVVGYFSAKNGVGLRLFLNRASSSVGIRPLPPGQKILPFDPASPGGPRASRRGAGFNGSYHDREELDTDSHPRRPDGGAGRPRRDQAEEAEAREPSAARAAAAPPRLAGEGGPLGGQGISRQQVVAEVLALLRAELAPSLQAAAARAASREHEKTRQWLEAAGLPKVARVAQREAYNVLRRHGLPGLAAAGAKGGAGSQLRVGAHAEGRYEPRRLTAEELGEAAAVCAAQYERRGQAIEVTLAELSAAAGAYLLAEDAPEVRRLAEGLIRGAAGEA